MPSHDSIKLWSAPLEDTNPVAVHQVAATHETAVNMLEVLFALFKLVTVDHVVPFHDSINAFWVVPSSYDPTAVQEDIEIQETPLRPESILVLAGGLVAMDQLVPFHDSIKAG